MIYDGMTPLLTTVDFAGFDIKLRAFLSEENGEHLFIVPAANVQPTHEILFREYNVRALSLDQFVKLAVRELPKEKVILKVHLNQLGLLTDTIFNKPVTPPHDEKKHEVWGYGIPWRDPDSGHRKRSMKVISFGGKEIEILLGDITKMNVDAVISSDGSYLNMSGGVSRAIRKAGGSVIQKQTRQHIPVELGSVIATSAGRLYAKYVIHSAVVTRREGTVCSDVDIVRRATINCLNEADRLGCQSIAMPALGTGGGKLDVEFVVYAMIDTVFEELENKHNLQKVTIVLYRQDILFDYLKASLEKRTFYL